MDYEKYNNALEKARVRYNEIKDTDCSEKKFLLDLFPELKESEDERIRKGLIKALSSIGKRNWGGIDVFESIAWLERQKAIDKEIIFRPLAGTDIIAAANQALEKIEIGKEVVLAFNGAYIPVNGKTVAEICNEYFSWTEKQGEQKVPINDFKAKNWYVSEVDGKIHDMTYNSADKTEPKFKVGDWIITKDKNVHKDYSVCKIVKIENNRYHLENGDYLDIDTLEQYDYRLWTIEDANDGDVLACGDKVYDCPFIFHNLTEGLNPRSYCGVNTLHHFQDNDENGGFWCKSDEVRPATKEQRELLFKKMKEAGYQWNPDKKKLKLLISNGGDFESNNSKQKPVNDTVETIVEAVSNTSILDMIEDKDAFTNPNAFENSLGRLLKLFEKLPKQDLLDGLKFYTNVVEHDGEYVKPTEWSEEDEKMINVLLEGFRYHQLFNPTFGEVPNAEIIAWIKSLKERLL